MTNNGKDDTYYINPTALPCPTCEQLRAEISMLRLRLRQLSAGEQEGEHDD